MSVDPSHHDTGHQPRSGGRVRRVAVLGSTGSVGTQTLDAISHLNTLHDRGEHPDRYEVVALAAGQDSAALVRQSIEHPAAMLGLSCTDASGDGLDADRLLRGSSAPTRLIEETRPDLVIGAIVGIAGLGSTVRAAQLGIDIALANKESLVAGGAIVTQATARSGAKILPVDSEHAGLWQCLLGLYGPDYAPPSLESHPSIRRVTLTASGGPFRDSTLQEIQDATLEQALNHPTWSMGPKVSIDSATLMNKALELIEAHWLFGLSADQLDAVIHPQSTIHALVETVDRSVLAHLGPTDMRCPIQHALTHPYRAIAQASPIDLATLGSLSFIAIDPDRFPAISIAKRVIEEGGGAGAVFNAANEAAVEAFVRGMIGFGAITGIVEDTLDRVEHRAADSLEAVLGIHEQARAIAGELIQTHAAHAR